MESQPETSITRPYSLIAASALLSLPGQDPIIGSPPPKLAITIKGLEGREHINLEAISKDADSSFVIPGVTQEFFVTSKGGEYFFVPSVSTLQRLANK